MKLATLATTALCALLVAATPAFVAAPASATPSLKIAPAPLIPLPAELDSAFYRPPAATVAKAKPGQILGARRITPANLGLVPINVDAWQLSFRSTDTKGRAIPAVTTVLKPRGTTKGPRKVISMQIAEDSTAGHCSVSYAVQQFNASSLLGQVVAPAELLIAQGFLAQGYAVVLPDHEGPNYAYAAGPLGAHITLDSLRAVKAFAPSSVTNASPIGLYGYSGGAIVTGHTAELKKSYAPELNIVGAAEGGVPANLKDLLLAAQNGATSGLVFGAVVGLSREYDYFRTFLDRNVDPLGKAVMALKGPLCVQYQAMTFPFMNNLGFIRWPGGALQAPAVKRLLADTKMGKSTPDMPMYIWNSQLDEIVPIHQVNQLVNTYCRDPKAQVTYTRDHLSEHLIGEVSGAPMAFLWLKDRLDGKPAKAGCTTRDELTMASDARWWPTFSATIGSDLASLFGKALGAGK